MRRMHHDWGTILSRKDEKPQPVPVKSSGDARNLPWAESSWPDRKPYVSRKAQQSSLQQSSPVVPVVRPHTITDLVRKFAQR